MAWHHRNLNPFTCCVDYRLWREEEAANLHSATAVLNPLLVIRGANHKGVAAAEPVDNVALSDVRKSRKRLFSKEIFNIKVGVTGEQATAVVKAKHACNSKRKTEEQVVQAHMNQ